MASLAVRSAPWNSGSDDVGEEEEDQRDRAENGEAAHEDVPAGQAILERANAALALQLRRIEVNSLGRDL